MKTMHSKEELWESVNEGIEAGEIEGGFDPSELVGKFVQVIEAPESTTLTDEQIALFREGIFVNGTFLGFSNPVFYPAVELADINTIGSLVVGRLSQRIYVSKYVINKSTKAISLVQHYMEFDLAGSSIYTSKIFLNGKNFPDYPTDTTKAYKLVQQIGGTLAWEEDA